MSYPSIDPRKCIKCRQCKNICPTKAISSSSLTMRDDGRVEVNTTKCIKCGKCIAICPKLAISW